MRKQKLLYASAAFIAGAAAVYAAGRRSHPARSVGSQTNASGAIDPPDIPPDASPDEILDVAVQYTFPASDPIAIGTSYRKALQREAARTA